MSSAQNPYVMLKDPYVSGETLSSLKDPYVRRNVPVREMYQWMADHWVTTMLVLGIVIAASFIMFNRSRLFYKE